MSWEQAAGALGVIVFDQEGKCEHYDQRCIPGADKGHGELFAALDVPEPW